MTSFFHNINIWLALSVTKTSDGRATTWPITHPNPGCSSRPHHTALGVLRLRQRSNDGRFQHVRGCRLGYYDELLSDELVSFHPEPWGIEDTFRQTTSGHRSQPATKTIGDCCRRGYRKRKQLNSGDVRSRPRRPREKVRLPHHHPCTARTSSLRGEPIANAFVRLMTRPWACSGTAIFHFKQDIIGASGARYRASRDAVQQMGR